MLFAGFLMAGEGKGKAFTSGIWVYLSNQMKRLRHFSTDIYLQIFLLFLLWFQSWLLRCFHKQSLSGRPEKTRRPRSEPLKTGMTNTIS